ncbi:glycoside hydrolase domain-containing protein [Puia sp. P3]|uniref:glycoside hydrolase domain-containing protein n=1 Tax=Puia sp. P3 TaxID=3423952 RepID=UPI003D66AA0B
MRSLGHEIYSPGKGGGFSWLQEHVGDDYIPAWFVPEIKDAALINSGMSRWHNYYVEGMNWLVQNVGIDGIYLDDVAFDRVTMKRIKRVLTRDGHPGIIDLHSANQYNKSDGFNNSANLYMEHFPYLNRLWFGEYFDYEKNDPSFFLTEVSGIPFGLMGEMLQDGGNPWRGMVYGMTNRMPWSDNADPRAIWKVWDEFGMKGTEMIGYWSGRCPVSTTNNNILSTVYKRRNAALVAIASWALSDTTVRLKIDWARLGIDSSRAVIEAPAIRNFQPAADFRPGDAISVGKGKGWLLIIKAAPAVAKVQEYKKDFPTYPFSDPSPIPMNTAVYPYFRYDGFTTKAVDKQWKVVELENQWIRLLILPEIGGKVWAAIEKSTNKPFLYYNHAVKFRDIAMRGPWTSGGLEANYGIIGHTPNCATPVDYLTRTNDDGSVSCFIGTLDLLTRSYWRVEIRLPADKAYFTTRSFWYNATPLYQPYYHWMNAGLKADGDLEFVYPGNKYLGHNGEYGSWPINPANGKNVAFYKNNDFGGYKSYHVFGKYTDFAGAYWHNDDYGMVRYGTHDDKAGKKIWIWGLSRQGMIWDRLLTDTDGQYVELQSGRLFNQNTGEEQPDAFQAPRPGAFPDGQLEGVLVSGAGHARNRVGQRCRRAEYRAGRGLGEDPLSPTQAIDDTLRVGSYLRALHLAPLQLFVDSFSLAGPDSLTATLGRQLLTWSSSPTAGDLSRPVDAPANFDWTSAYGHYLAGCEDMDQKNYAGAEASFDSALLRDAWLLPALVKKAGLLYRNMRYAEALDYSRRALSVNTEDGGANFIYGLVNMQLGKNADAADGFDIASLSPAWRSAAYTQLARLYLISGNWPRAAVSAEKALVAQPQNMDALQLQAVIARQRGDSRSWRSTLATLLRRWIHLNHFARFENEGAAVTALIRNELPQETYLELAIWYHGCGLSGDAIRVLALAPPVAEVKIWQAWLTHSSRWIRRRSIRCGLFLSFGNSGRARVHGWQGLVVAASIPTGVDLQRPQQTR